MAAKMFQLAVCGLHLRGQPLNSQLTNLSSTFVKACYSAPTYKCAELCPGILGESCAFAIWSFFIMHDQLCLSAAGCMHSPMTAARPNRG
jgi:hypothetical protein